MISGTMERKKKACPVLGRGGRGLAPFFQVLGCRRLRGHPSTSRDTVLGGGRVTADLLFYMTDAFCSGCFWRLTEPIPLPLSRRIWVHINIFSLDMCGLSSFSSLAPPLPLSAWHLHTPAGKNKKSGQIAFRPRDKVATCQHRCQTRRKSYNRKITGSNP